MIRFAASFDGIMMVLSGMGNMQMMTENIGFMKEFVSLNEQEREAVDKVRDIFRSQDIIPCTACRYCTERCPQHLSIRELLTEVAKEFD